MPFFFCQVAHVHLCQVDSCCSVQSYEQLDNIIINTSFSVIMESNMDTTADIVSE